MKQIKVSDLEGEQLAEWAALAHEWTLHGENEISPIWIDEKGNFVEYVEDYRPDINNAQAMELQEKMNIGVYPICENEWEAVKAIGENLYYGYGETPRIAITRAAIASVYGEIVTVDDE